MIKDNYYNILEIPETASPDEIRKAYRKLSLQQALKGQSTIQTQ